MHALNVSSLHTTHCLPNGDVMISTMGDGDGNGKGDFLLIDAEEGVIKGGVVKIVKLNLVFVINIKLYLVFLFILTIETWTKGKTAKFGYDFWYQPYWDVLVSSEWGTPKYFKTGFHAEHVNDIGIYL